MKIALANYVDLIRAESGDIPSDSVRRFEVDGIVDTGSLGRWNPWLDTHMDYVTTSITFRHNREPQ